MFIIKNILVTTDFSDYSAAALDHALSLAEIHDAKVHLLHVVEERTGLSRHKGAAGSDSTPKSGEALAARRMSRFVFEHIDEYTTVLESIRSGIPHVEFIRYAKEHAIDLIVIATHGRTGLSHVVVGSVAERVVRYSPVPVLTVKPLALLEQLATGEDIAQDLHLPHP